MRRETLHTVSTYVCLHMHFQHFGRIICKPDSSSVSSEKVYTLAIALPCLSRKEFKILALEVFNQEY